MKSKAYIYFSFDKFFYIFKKDIGMERSSSDKLAHDLHDFKCKLMMENGCDVVLKHIHDVAPRHQRIMFLMLDYLL